MFIDLIYITNSAEAALIAQQNGVKFIMVDLERMGKEDRQKGRDTVISNHFISDVEKISKVLTKSKTLVRINPWHEGSYDEIEKVIEAGADSIMLPMWKNPKEVDLFLKAVNKRTSTMLLLETKEAVECVDEVLNNDLIDEIYIGLNDLHLSYGLTFMFELLSNGVVEELCNKFKQKGIVYGFGGIARISEGLLPAEHIIMEHHRLCSTRTILSRTFCNLQEIENIVDVEKIFKENIKKIRAYEKLLSKKDEKEFLENKKYIKYRVNQVVEIIKEKKKLCI